MRAPPSAWRRASGLAGVGIEMVFAVVFGAVGGSWADARWDLDGAGTLVGLGLGAAAAGRSVVRLVRRLRPAPGPTSTKEGPSP